MSRSGCRTVFVQATICSPVITYAACVPTRLSASPSSRRSLVGRRVVGRQRRAQEWAVLVRERGVRGLIAGFEPNAIAVTLLTGDREQQTDERREILFDICRNDREGACGADRLIRA